MHKKVFTEAAVIAEEFAALLSDYNLHASIRWEPDLLLTLIFANDL